MSIYFLRSVDVHIMDWPLNKNQSIPSSYSKYKHFEGSTKNTVQGGWGCEFIQCKCFKLFLLLIFFFQIRPGKVVQLPLSSILFGNLYLQPKEKDIHQ